MNMKSFLIVVMFLAGFGVSATAQQNEVTESDLDVVSAIGYDPNVILSDWQEWYSTPKESNAFIGEFMKTNNVPQKGIQNLNREETWYWWISNHKPEIMDYLELKKANKKQSLYP